MENFFTRYKNPLVLMAVLFIQVIALATQVKRPDNARASGSGGTRLIRVWTLTAITPFERAFVATGHFFRDTWRDYVDLHNVRKQNRELQEELARMRLEQVRLRASAEQTQRLQALLEFKERYVGHTIAAQVIGSSGSDLSHIISIDKGSSNGIRPDMAVITPHGIVGKVKDVFPLSSQVLMITDRDSSAGVILQNSRLQGVMSGTGQGDLLVNDVMSDEKVDVGEQVVTSGDDRIFPKGLPVGAVTSVSSDSEGGPFLAVKIKPAASLSRLEEVLIVTEIVEEVPAEAGATGQHRAAEILSQRLPSASKPVDNAPGPATGTAPRTASQNPSLKPASPNPAGLKKITSGNPAANSNTPANGAASGPGASGPAKTSGSNGSAPSGKAGPRVTSNVTTNNGATTSGTTTGGTTAGGGVATGATGTPSPRPKPKSTATPGQATPAGTPQSTPPTRNQKPAGGDAEKPPQ